MIGYAQLWAADPTAWRAAGTAWRGLDAMVRRRAAEVARTRSALADSWAGPAAGTAGTRLDTLRGAVEAAAPALVEIDQILAEFAALLVRAKALLDAAVRGAAMNRVLIDRHGGVSLDPAVPQVDPRAGAAVLRVGAQIRAALELATRADREAAGRLTGLATAAVTGWTTEPPPDRPAGDADPAAVRRWWDDLSPAQRRWLVRHEPALVGGLDGVPVAMRDQANRLLLPQLRADLLARRAELLATWPRLPGNHLEGLRIAAILGGLDAIEARLAAESGPRAYLLGLDPAGDGRTVVALGDPDRADHVVTYVPGMTSDLPSADGELGRAERILARAAELAPDQPAAAVLWLDYDAPDFVHEAHRASYAHDAGPALHRFQEGLRASHEGGPAHQTVVGHSYGSLVVGSAARDHGLAADDLVLVGSPGVGVDHARDLGLPAGRVWASTAGNDVIRYVPSVGALAGDLALGVALPGIGPVLAFSRPGDDLWFGHDPSDRDFGARVFASDPNGHTGYWDHDNRALDAMARIALGDAGRLPATPP
ncbi:alpha/beta hydrolase [Polymorphospora sp. NPDC050346]|uniref:alpha/beta hydrolase n=1 Tax=Polymorphospora sp. NPDC050346 TaxID=3155780 RepID=UPI0033EB521D